MEEIKENGGWKERLAMSLMGNIVAVIVGLLVLMFVAAFASCSTHKEAVRESSVRVDTVYKVAVRQDTVRTRDSVWVETWLRGDTVYRVKEVTRWRERLALRTDTVYKAALRSDTIRVPVAVERRLSWWERNVEKPMAKIGISMLLAMAIVALIPIGEWLWRKIVRREE